MSAIEVTTATAPASWACYLVNGDASSFDTPTNAAGSRDKADCDHWVDQLAKDGWYVVNCEGESEFSWRNDATGARYGADVITYVLHRKQEGPRKRGSDVDPNETYRMWWRAVLAEDRDAANEAYNALRCWIERGGFEPNWGGPIGRRQFFTYDVRTGQISLDSEGQS